MDSVKTETLDVNAPPPATTGNPAPISPNPTSTTSTASPSTDLSIATNGEAKNEGAVEKGDQKTAVPLTSPTATDLEKKMRRAERFGVAVVMSEEEKRNNRAERFGTGAVSVRAGSTGLEEEQKRKARAERFGLSGTIEAVDEAAKKKARLERFSQGPKVDAAEEEKKKARAIRFSKSSTSPPQPNTQDSSDIKEAASVTGIA